jgi:Protein of unknown function (DUF3551)
MTVLAMATQTPARALPYDPYPWCADYSSANGGGGTNCGFLTIEQCRATVSGIGGFCVPNKFYNPQGSAARLPKKTLLIRFTTSVELLASSLRIWPITKQRSEDRANDPRLPVRSRTLILPRCPEARGNIELDLNTDSKVLRTLGPRWRNPYGSRLRTIKRFSSRRL